MKVGNVGVGIGIGIGALAAAGAYYFLSGWMKGAASKPKVRTEPSGGIDRMQADLKKKMGVRH